MKKNATSSTTTTELIQRILRIMAGRIRGKDNGSGMTGQGCDAWLRKFLFLPRDAGYSQNPTWRLRLTREGRRSRWLELRDAFPECRDGRAAAGSAVGEAPMPQLIGPDPPAN